MNNQNFIPNQRTAIDGRVWWCVFDTVNQKYSSLISHGKYKTKKVCQQAIELHKEN